MDQIELTGIIVGIPFGILTTFISLLIYHKLVAPKISFSENIRTFRVSRLTPVDRYSVRIVSPKRVSLIDVKLSCQIYIYDMLENDRKFWNAFEIPISIKHMTLFTPGTFTLHLFPNKSDAIKNHSIMDVNLQKKAQRNELRLEEIFMRYRRKCHITISIVGNDRITGIKKLYESPNYELFNFVDGEWLDSSSKVVVRNSLF